MLQDLEAGKSLELDCMTGAIVELAGRMGIAVPHIQTVHACALLLDRIASGKRGALRGESGGSLGEKGSDLPEFFRA